MRPTFIDLDVMEPGTAPALITSNDQHAALDLPAAVTPEGDVVSRWTLTPGERAAIARGADIYLFIRTFGQALQPQKMLVGPEGGAIVEGTCGCGLAACPQRHGITLRPTDQERGR